MWQWWYISREIREVIIESSTTRCAIANCTWWTECSATRQWFFWILRVFYTVMNINRGIWELIFKRYFILYWFRYTSAVLKIKPERRFTSFTFNTKSLEIYSRPCWLIIRIRCEFHLFWDSSQVRAQQCRIVTYANRGFGFTTITMRGWSWPPPTSDMAMSINSETAGYIPEGVLEQ